MCQSFSKYPMWPTYFPTHQFVEKDRGRDRDREEKLASSSEILVAIARFVSVLASAFQQAADNNHEMSRFNGKCG